MKKNDRYITELNQEAIDFLLYSYFGIRNDEDEKSVALKCAQRAYLDLNRTLEYNKELKKDKGIDAQSGELCRGQFKNIICEVIVSQIYKRILNNCKNFEDEHENICKLTIKLADGFKFKSHEDSSNYSILSTEFKYGQAQKWLNMTLKYMWLLGLWKDKLDALNLHVPVDSYILRAVSEQNEKKKNEEKVLIPRKDGKNSYKYSESCTKPWSEWHWEEIEKYKKFQEKLGENRKKWEGKAWIDIAEKKKEEEKARIEEAVVEANALYEITLSESPEIEDEIKKEINGLLGIVSRHLED